MNPFYTDSNTKLASSAQDINGNMSSICVVTYETFPKHKQSNENSSPVIYTKGNPRQNGQLQNRHAENERDTTTDINRNKLVRTKGEKNGGKHERDDVYNVVKLQGNKPVLLGPGNSLSENGDKLNRECPEKMAGSGKTQKGKRDQALLGREVENEVLDEITEGKFDPGAQEGAIDANGEIAARSVDQQYNCLDEKDVVVEIEHLNSNHPDHVTDVMTDSLVADRQTDRRYERSCHDNYTFGYNEAIDGFGERGNTKGQRNPLVHQNELDEDPEHNTDKVNMIDELIARIPDKGKRSVSTEILTEAIVHVDENNEAKESRVEQGQEKDQLKGPANENGCFSVEQTVDDWPDIDSLVRHGHDDFVTDTQCPKSVHFAADIHKHARSVSDVIQANLTDDSSESSHMRDNNGKTTTIYSKNTKKAKSVTFSSNGSTRTLRSILSNSCSASQCSHSESCSHRHSDSESEIHELKSVKFSKDTVFHENKSSKYKQEKVSRINLREIYQGKIFSESALAKMNPIYTEDDRKGEGDGKQGSMTDDEKLAYQISLKKALKISKSKVGLL